MSEDLRRVGFAREGHAARQQLVEHATQRVDIGGGIYPVARDLLRSDVVERPHVHPARGQPTTLVVALGQPEVGQVNVLFGVLAADEHVARLDVAVDQPACVSGIEGARNLADQSRGVRRPESPGAPSKLPKVGPVHEPHRDEHDAPVLPDLVDRDDVRMLDLRGYGRLLLEPRAEGFVARQLGGDDLESDHPIRPGLTGSKHETHPATTYKRFDTKARELISYRRLSKILHGRSFLKCAWGESNPRPAA